MRVATALFSLLILSGPAQAGFFDRSPRNYYGPMQGGAGFKEEATPDGYWKIEFSGDNIYDPVFVIDAALYRGAELARAQGHRFVEYHDGYSRSSRTSASAVVFIKGTNDPVAPARCRSGKPKRCYTADIAVVLKRLSGASGREPGVAAPSAVDQYGRTVYESGFGTGAVAR